MKLSKLPLIQIIKRMKPKGAIQNLFVSYLKLKRDVMLEAEFRIAVIEKFRELQQKMAALQVHLCERDVHLPVWFQTPDLLASQITLSLREAAFSMLRQFEYLPVQNPREILVGAGLIAASAETLEAIEAVNEAKQQFKQAILALKNAKIPLHDTSLETGIELLLQQRPPHLAQTLKKIGLARLHLKQCYRLIPFYRERPEKVSWTWAHTRAIKRISRTQAEQMLIKQNKDSSVQQQIQKLAALPAHEPLAIVQELAPHLRANVLFANGQRKMVKGPVPIFYLETGSSPLPYFKPPSEKQPRNQKRCIRSDVKLDPQVFLPAIRAHRYQKA